MSVPVRQIRARYSADTITVYQAYPPQITLPAVAAGRFVAPFKRDRMTWIKPSFLWMMYRCGWATKPEIHGPWRGHPQVGETRSAVSLAVAGCAWCPRGA